MIRIITILLFIFMLCSCDNSEADQKRFVIKHDMGYAGIPEMPFERIHPLGQNESFYKEVDDIHTSFPDEQTVRQLSLTTGINTDFYLNIEHLPTGHQKSQLEQAESIHKLANIFHWIKSERPTIQIGIYRILPERGPGFYWWVDAWRDRNTYFERLATYVDVIYPSLYTFYEGDIETWLEYANQNVTEARKYNKPVIVFLWPQYHGSSQTAPNGVIDGAFWRSQLEWCYQNVDGIVIWGGWNFNWSDIASDTDPSNWWYQTLEFMNSKGL